MPQLNWPKLDITDAEESVAFDVVDRILRTDPDVKRIFGRNIYSWQGDAQDDMDPNVESCPWLRITPSPEASDWTNVGQHKMPMLVSIEVACIGTRVKNLMNLFALVRQALFPADAARLTEVQGWIDATAITKVRFVKPAYAIRKDKDGTKLLVGVGGLELNLLINT